MVVVVVAKQYIGNSRKKEAGAPSPPHPPLFRPAAVVCIISLLVLYHRKHYDSTYLPKK